VQSGVLPRSNDFLGKRRRDELESAEVVRRVFEENCDCRLRGGNDDPFGLTGHGEGMGEEWVEEEIDLGRRKGEREVGDEGEGGDGECSTE
jgi:hypothetical protein